MATDPVCGLDLDESEANARTDYEGRTYLFCSTSCRDEFESNPQHYALAAAAAAAVGATAGG